MVTLHTGSLAVEPATIERSISRTKKMYNVRPSLMAIDIQNRVNLWHCSDPVAHVPYFNVCNH